MRKPTKAQEEKRKKLERLTQWGCRAAKRLRMNASHPERVLFRLLKDLHYKFEFQKPVIAKGSLYILDFYFTELNLGLEVQSKAYHSTPAQIKKDSIKKRRLKKEGIPIIYLWAKQIEIITKENVEQILSGFVKDCK